ncbi:TetR/AcrR family transcriptional regulator [Alkalicaulis satelles]|uniref:TetR/AcrR family transcriptional regulator n=1 Tax=Alkalicaulis satelles TaxID=2609175 RepID=A0A5M6ZBV6_9PROT|nr:TetR/AcrR family transcriptional regulator [Alkalicaulis satelles]KAA5802206.1 TetR/AcrR family transcriptional regulator [Alkalicaulis satelles]
MADIRLSNDAERPTREIILDAAERVVAREGSGRLTIDAVVRESGFSKGGVLYNFPSKQALIEGMVMRLIQQAQGDCDTALAEAEASGANPVAAVIRAILTFKSVNGDLAMAMLAAAAESPELLDPVRDMMARIREDVISRAPDPVMARIALLAADGLHLAELLGLGLITPDEQEAVEARLIQLVSEPSPT